MKKLILVLSLVHSIVSYSQPQFFGMTTAGGQNNAGVIFKTDGSGNNYTVVHDLFRFDGDYPRANLLKASDGMLYGVTSACCTFDGISVLFQYDPATDTYTRKYDFNDLSKGGNPYGALMQASDGKIYGMTSLGGAYNKGVLFQFDPATSIYIKKADFDGTVNGKTAQGALIEANDGKLYGMTCRGGANDYGVIFQYDKTSSALTKKIDFDGAANGSGPLGSLMQAADGMLYGMTNSGGANSYGVIFQYNPSTSLLTKKLDFDGPLNGRSPSGSFIQASDGKLYGMTSYGGTNDMGVLFQYNTATSTIVKKIDFDGVNNGSCPWGDVMQATDGKLYGMTHDGGLNDAGVIFQYDISNGNLSKKSDFIDKNGKHPCCSLVQHSDGKLYAMAYDGGMEGVGVLFQFDPLNFVYTKKFDFHFSQNGAYLIGALMQASDGMLYGTSRDGGLNESGVIFQFNYSTSVYSKKIDLEDISTGSSPTGSLIQATDGKLYGTTTFGGAYNKGVIFQYDPLTFTCTKKFDFDGAAFGGNPQGSLMQATDGKLYGMTFQGGENDLGVLFQFDPATSNYITKFDFDGLQNGANPRGALMQANDGKLYGMSWAGGANNLGVIFQYNPLTSSFSKKFDFDGTANGGNPWGNLTQANDGRLYGMCNTGGANYVGVLFQFDPVNSSFSKKFDFDDTLTGRGPTGSLLQASDGNLYGMVQEGGAGDKGVVFQFNPSTSACTTTHHFTMQSGSFPNQINLIEVGATNSIAHTPSQEIGRASCRERVYVLV